MCRLKRRSAVALRVVALPHWLFSQRHYQLRDQAVPLVLCLITITSTVYQWGKTNLSHDGLNPAHVPYSLLSPSTKQMSISSHMYRSLSTLCVRHSDREAHFRVGLARPLSPLSSTITRDRERERTDTFPRVTTVRKRLLSCHSPRD